MEDSGEFTHEDGGLDTGEFDTLEKELATKVEKYAKEKAAEEWSTREDAYFEFPESFPDGNEEMRKKVLRELGGKGPEHLTPQSAALRYLDNPNNRENGAFRYLVDWGIDPNRNGEGIRLSFQNPPSNKDKKEIGRIFRTFGWNGEEYEVKKELAKDKVDPMSL